MRQTERALVCIVHSGDYERVRFALAIAAAAAAASRRVTLFFTMGACPALLSHDGWHRLRVPDGSALAEDTNLRDKGVAGFEELRDACKDLRVRLIACDMGLRAADLSREQLDPNLGVETGGLFSLLSGEGAEAQLVFC